MTEAQRYTSFCEVKSVSVVLVVYEHDSCVRDS
jgi:hypothetical protein